MDGDLDIGVVSAFNKWDDPEAQSMIWFENDGEMGFKPRSLVSDLDLCLAQHKKCFVIKT